MERNTEYFVEQVARRYPGLDIKQIRQVCTRLMRRVYYSGYMNRDIRIYSASRTFSLKIYTYFRDVEKHNQHYEKEAYNRRLHRFIIKRQLRRPRTP